MMTIREHAAGDWDAVWPIFREVVRAADVHAVHLYETLGFEIVGTVPGAFEHPLLGRVGLHIMYRDLAGGPAAA